jgi:hypothetical protein
MADYNCGECKYWLLIADNDSLGYCRFNPPSIPEESSGRQLPDGSGRIVKRCNWPVTKQAQYCAQFKQAKGPSTNVGLELWD